MYCSLHDSLVKFLNRTKSLKRYKLTPKKAIEYNLVDSMKRANSLVGQFRSGRSVEYLANKLIFWKYDSYETVYEDYNYTFQRIMETKPEKRWEKFNQIYPT